MSDTAQARLRSKAGKLARNMRTMRVGLQRMGRRALLLQVDQAMTAPTLV